MRYSQCVVSCLLLNVYCRMVQAELDWCQQRQLGASHTLCPRKNGNFSVHKIVDAQNYTFCGRLFWWFDNESHPPLTDKVVAYILMDNFLCCRRMAFVVESLEKLAAKSVVMSIDDFVEWKIPIFIWTQCILGLDSFIQITMRWQSCASKHSFVCMFWACANFWRPSEIRQYLSHSRMALL